MNLDQLAVFVKVVQAGSFTRAADVMQSQKSHVSRVISQLESQLGVKLLERTTRSLRVTEIGKELFERAVGIQGAIEDMERVAHNTHGEPRGTLRITCGVEFGMIAVSGWVNEFLDSYPMVLAEVEYTSRVLDLVHEGFDLAIRVGMLDDSRLAARSLGTIEYGLFACPRYVARLGMPESVEALKHHALIMFTGGSHRSGWQLRRDAEMMKIESAAKLRVNNSFAVRDALLRSLGVGQLPLMVASDCVKSGRLVQVLPDWAPSPVPVHAVFPGNRYLTPKVRAFVDLAVARFPSENAFSDWRGNPRRCHPDGRNSSANGAERANNL
jgi:LysR family transcriptional regulator for bpeEF and oprC